MARQAGPIYFTGTVGDLIFYKLGENYYVRQKGKPTTGTQKQLKDPNCYPVLNRRKREFGAASKLASSVYRQLPKALKKQHSIGTLTGRVGRLLRAGKLPDEAIALLKQELLPAAAPAQQPLPAKPAAASKKKTPARMTLSAWQVSAKGQLKKPTRPLPAAGKQHAANTENHTAKGCCIPCRAVLVPIPVKDSG